MVCKPRHFCRLLFTNCVVTLLQTGQTDDLIQKVLDEWERSYAKKLSLGHLGKLKGKRAPSTADTYIYLLQQGNTNFYKIGITKSIEHRLRQLQSGCPEKLKVVRYIKGRHQDEKYLHYKHQAYKKVGEWFELTEQQAATALELPMKNPLP